jgi:hypothetical protein
MDSMVSKAITVALVLVFAFEVVPPALLAGACESSPACCRRDGKHHCLSQSGLSQSAPEGPLLATVRCPYFPTTATAPGGQRWAASPSRQATAAVFSHPAAKAQTEAYYRISLIRGAQKRGPPSLV